MTFDTGTKNFVTTLSNTVYFLQNPLRSLGGRTLAPRSIFQENVHNTLHAACAANVLNLIGSQKQLCELENSYTPIVSHR